MENQLFSGLVRIEIQGDETLDILSIDAESITFQVTGFDSPKIFLHDFRQSILDDLQYYKETGDISHFQIDFNSTAIISIIENNTDLLEINIYSNTGYQTSTPYYFWVVIGFEDSIPAYDYLLWYIRPISENRFAMMSIYRDSSLSTEEFQVNSYLHSNYVEK